MAGGGVRNLQHVETYIFRMFPFLSIILSHFNRWVVLLITRLAGLIVCIFYVGVCSWILLRLLFVILPLLLGLCIVSLGWTSTQNQTSVLFIPTNIVSLIMLSFMVIEQTHTRIYNYIHNTSCLGFTRRAFYRGVGFEHYFFWI